MTEQQILAGLASIIVLGVGAEWIAWRLKIPSILPLLAVGFVAGPLTGRLQPDIVLGDLVSPLVSLLVAIILFEGAMHLRLAELRQVGNIILRLVVVGSIATWAIAVAAGWAVLGFDVRLAILLGAVLVVNGPSVIGTVLRHARPVGRLGAIVKSEAVALDTIGAMLALLVFQAISVEGFDEAATLAIRGVIQTVVLGSLVGALGAGAMILLLTRYWLPDPLESPATLMFVVVVFAAANALQPEAGFFAAAVLGVLLANQRRVGIRHIAEFQENIRILIISGLFIVLAARLELDDLMRIDWRSVAFLGLLVLIARPVAVALAALGSNLRRNERAFLAWMAPRGFVAAALSSVFAIRLADADIPEVQRFVPEVFFVIVGTVAIYGLTTVPVARMLGVAQRKQQGVLIIGAYTWAREIAQVLQNEGFPVLLVDTNRTNTTRSRMQGIPTFSGSILADDLIDKIDLDGIGRLLAMTSNDEVNSLAAVRFTDLFGRSEVYQFAPQSPANGGQKVSTQLRGRILFDETTNFTTFTVKFAGGAQVRATPITKQFDLEDLHSMYREVSPLFLITESGDLTVYTADNQPTPKPGQTLISLVAGNG